MIEHFDVLVVGAGLSGIGAGVHLLNSCKGKTFAVLEAREAIGGTWDLFRYPGIRSDSDMYTLGYPFKPWLDAKAIADGPAILDYIRETAVEYGVDKRIRYSQRLVKAAWDSLGGCWTVTVEKGGAREIINYTCNFLFMCVGYYDYAQGYLPEFSGVANFGGTLVHPQFWPDHLDYRGKQVVVIGSGATAMTLVPQMAKDAGLVTMLQRSPTFVVSRPAKDKIADWLREHLPMKLAYAMVRWKNVLQSIYYYRLARKYPVQVKAGLVKLVSDALGPNYDVTTHFTPRYNPWDQRICLVPDSDLFEAIKSGKADVVTDTIDHFVEDGIQLSSGAKLPADIVVTATGLKMQLMSGITVEVDGQKIDFSKSFSYKGMMYSNVPNLASSFGYTNASWTLKCDLTCGYVCRLVNYMAAHGMDECRPVADLETLEESPFLDFTSGYVQRARDEMPKQGAAAPWKVYQNYVMDLIALKFGKVDDGTMKFSKRRMLQAAE